MLESPSVLSHLATKFAVHPENWATEALAFVLGSSFEARQALGRFLDQLGWSAGGDLYISTQQPNEDGSRPDIVGKDVSGETRLVVEAKFWAGLTAAQPVDYLAALPSTGLLLFVTPAARVHTVWPELLRRAADATYTAGVETTPFSGTKCVSFGAARMAITSWRKLLDSLLSGVEAAGEVHGAADLRQLASLCDQMDQEAFLPLLSEEATSTIGRRIVQFGDLAIAISSELVRRDLASIQGVRANGGNGWYGRALYLRNHNCYLSFEATRWARLGHPLWLDVLGHAGKFSEAVRVALTAAGIDCEAEGNRCGVPIRLPIGVEREGVLQSCIAQVEKVLQALPEALGSPPVEGDDGELSP